MLMLSLVSSVKIAERTRDLVSIGPTMTFRKVCPELAMLHNPETLGHFVQFYEDDVFMVENVSYLVGRSLSAGNSSVLIATESHLNLIENRLADLDLKELRAAGRYVALDAEATLVAVFGQWLAE
jgi:hypothetical protein